MKTRSVLLLATNKTQYLKFAINCVASIQIHNPGLPVFIATNIKTGADLPGIQFLSVSDELANLFIEAKLYLDTFLQTDETLFIDSDCLCFGNLDPIFDACQGMDVTVIGRLTPLEKYWGTGENGADFARKEFAIDNAILFNGGFYYIKKSPLTTVIFNRAREISLKYDEYGFHRIQNNWKNEEDLLAIAMIANKQRPINDDGQFMSDLATDLRPRILNVLKGARRLTNRRNPPRSYYPATYSPVILHFGGSNIKSYPYISQSLLLRLFKTGLPVAVSSLIVGIFVDMPYKLYYWAKKSVSPNPID